MPVNVDVAVRIDLAEAARLLNERQLRALFWGIGQVVSAQEQSASTEQQASTPRVEAL